MSGGTGEHAGHLIGIQFGAPGDIRNLGLQNPNMNTFAPKVWQDAFKGHGGSYHDLESQWAEQLQASSKIRVTVKDKYSMGENRPFSRWVPWIETKPGAPSGLVSELEFGNFSSPQMRAANQYERATPFYRRRIPRTLTKKLDRIVCAPRVRKSAAGITMRIVCG
jgi:hypothetical protein